MLLLLLVAVDVEHGGGDGGERVFTILPPRPFACLLPQLVHRLSKDKEKKLLIALRK